MTMLERCARAVKDARALPGTSPVARLSDVDRRVARAVLEALKEPTPEMIAAVWSKIDDAKLAKGIARLGPGPGVRDVIAAYIEAILGDHP